MAMSDEQMLDTVEQYIERMRVAGVLPVECDTSSVKLTNLDKWCHVRHLAERFVVRVREGGYNRDKMMRWLGFIQCAFWLMNVLSINDLKRDNR